MKETVMNAKLFPTTMFAHFFFLIPYLLIQNNGFLGTTTDDYDFAIL